jgi:hypothetical protein
MQEPSHDSVRELAGMLVRVTVGTETYAGAIRERDGRRLRLSTSAPLRLRAAFRIALVDTDERFGTVQLGARVTSILSGARGPECWCDIARVVAAADTAFLARVVEPLIGSTPTSWLAFRREGPWTSYDLDPAASVDLPALFITPPPPAADAAPDTRPPVTYEPPRAIPSHLLEDCHARALSIRLTLAGDSRPCTVHRAASDGSRALARVPGAPPALGDAATIIVDAPDGSPALTLAATVGWVDRTSLVDDATELVLVLSTRTPRDFREAWTRRLNASAPG